jgi:hypothetical protein
MVRPLVFLVEQFGGGASRGYEYRGFLARERGPGELFPGAFIPAQACRLATLTRPPYPDPSAGPYCLAVVQDAGSVVIRVYPSSKAFWGEKER